jgi:mono/diheme cytochrome c family protein
MNTRTHFRMGAALLAVALAGIAIRWSSRSVAAEAAPKASGVVKIELPPETAQFRPGPGREVAQTLCITCHSADYLAMQPPMPRKFWEAAGKKMKDKFGAPLPEDLTPLVDYLTAAYGTK